MQIRLLLVEDNAGDARLVQEALRDVSDVGFDIDRTAVLAEALERLATNDYDVLLLDLSLPDSHGLGTLARVRSVAPTLPIVILTGYEDESTALRAMRGGAQDYLVKGQVVPRGLWRSIRYAIERNQAAVGPAGASDELRAALRQQLDVIHAEHELLEQALGGPKEAPGAELAEGGRVGNRYLLEDELGEGRFGRVFLAVDDVLMRKVVVKVLHAAHVQSEERVRDFLKEARLAASLDHPNVVRIFDFGYEGRVPYLVMEYAAGGSLADLLSLRGALSPAEAFAWMNAILRGLAHVHEKGVLHRDLKPANILVAANGTVKVADFGLALVREAAGAAGPLEGSLSPMGTPAFVSPEAIEGTLPLTRASDIYSAAAVLYLMLAGRTYLPFTGLTAEEIRRVVAEAPPLVPEDVPAPLAEVVLRGLAKRPEDRYATADAMREALEAAYAGLGSL